MIRGKKNFINPPKLELGLGFLFKIDDSCFEAHANDRKVKKLEGFEFKGEEVKENEEKQNEEYTLVTMSELQPRIKNVEKPQKGSKNDNSNKTINQNSNKSEKKINEVKIDKEKKRGEEQKPK